MIQYEDIIEAQEKLVQHWGEDGKRVIEKCHKVNPYNKLFEVFIREECSCCGGDWGAMILTGIRRLYPDVYDAIPNHMGMYAFILLCYICLLCGIDTTVTD